LKDAPHPHGAQSRSHPCTSSYQGRRRRSMTSCRQQQPPPRPRRAAEVGSRHGQRTHPVVEGRTQLRRASESGNQGKIFCWLLAAQDVRALAQAPRAARSYLPLCDPMGITPDIAALEKHSDEKRGIEPICRSYRVHGQFRAVGASGGQQPNSAAAARRRSSSTTGAPILAQLSLSAKRLRRRREEQE
jgi:hypothetical protein